MRLKNGHDCQIYKDVKGDSASLFKIIIFVVVWGTVEYYEDHNLTYLAAQLDNSRIKAADLLD
jgi:hypothetical protein